MVIQSNYKDKWASDLIYDRYQILEGWLSNGFYVYDHEIDDQIRDKGGAIIYFKDPVELQQFIDDRNDKEEKKARGRKGNDKDKGSRG
jgi:hypothetical protein